MTYRAMKERADRIANMIRDRARETCAAAGLDPNLLGIHPHNAMVSLHYGKPWPEVNYSLCRKTLWLLEKQWVAHQIVEQWYRRQPNERIPEIFELEPPHEAHRIARERICR